MGKMRRAEGREEERRLRRQRFASTHVIAAAIIVAVRLAREENISEPTPRVMDAVIGAISLAGIILDRVAR